MNQPKIVFTKNVSMYWEICKKNGWNPHQITFVNDINKLRAYYYEDVYPEWVAKEEHLHRRPLTGQARLDRIDQLADFCELTPAEIDDLIKDVIDQFGLSIQDVCAIIEIAAKSIFRMKRVEPEPKS